MKYAIISDIHSNLEALQAVLKKIDGLGVDQILCPGDIVGYGANPNECIDIVQQRASLVLCGNHDYAAVGATSIEFFNPHAREAIIWTEEVLRPDCAKYLEGLPYTASVDGAFLVHASPSEPNKWNYILQPADALHEFKCFEEDICFVGHSHFALFFEMQDDSCKRSLPSSFSLEKDRRYIVNIGSVGQPRDRIPAASFVTLETAKGIVQFHRVDYDYHLACEKILKAGLPRFLAERLLVGE
ncbi:MAG: metallophosphoesterase family protein [Candidatus Eiseniibacteriota bacterium]|nr:MAG: metallophosphoesterase family protein [Candidatus Eisenbacteria bacterium]